MTAVLVMIGLGCYLAGYFFVFLAVFRRFDAQGVEPGNPVSAALISLLWPAWLPGLALWWATRGRRIAAQRRANGGAEVDPC